MPAPLLVHAFLALAAPLKYCHMRARLDGLVMTNALETDWKRHSSRSGTGWMCKVKLPDGISCAYTASFAHHMKEHVEASHLKIRNHFCKECDYSSYRKQTLNKHMKTVHAKTGRYVCQECGHAEHRKMLMNSHMISVHKMQGF